LDHVGTGKKWHEILASLTPLILGLAATAVGAIFTQVYNFRQLELTQLSALEKFHSLLVSENPYDREFAYASFSALGYEQLALRIIQMKQDTAGRAVLEEIKQSGSTIAKQQASDALVSVPARVLLHVGSEAQKERAKAIVSKLQEGGFIVPAIENVFGTAQLPLKTNVRYFNTEDKTSAEAITQILKSHGVPDAYEDNVTRFKVRPGSLEVWFSPDALGK
jgi:hypothetical protein